MADLPQSLMELFPAVRDPQKKALLIRELQNQVARDFHCLTVPPAEELYFFLKEQLRKLIQHEEALRDLLYRVDVEEKSEDRYFLEQHSVEDLALKILKREAQKVVFRLQYSGKL